MKMVKATLYLLLAFAAASCAFAGRILEEHPVAAAPPVEAPLPADPLPVPNKPPVDPVVLPVPAPAAALPLPSATGVVVAPFSAGGVAGNGGVAAGDHPLTFFMRDILGSAGSKPSALMATGDASLVNLVHNNIGGKDIPSANAGDLPTGARPQSLLSGTTTIIDEDLTESHEFGAAVVGSAQGFHVASSRDGASRTVVLTAMFGGGEVHGDTLSFVGVHRTEATASHVTIVGGTGKYWNAKGFAAIQTLQTDDDQHNTESGKSLLQFDVHLS
uniref:Uncharacterized protein n=1 Tax=Avena sativa TaxID=4498 RepID=A0ACD5XK91_AVESA